MELILFENTTNLNKKCFESAYNKLLCERDIKRKSGKTRAIMISIAPVFIALAIIESTKSNDISASQVICAILGGSLIGIAIRINAFNKGIAMQKYAQNGNMTKFTVTNDEITAEKNSQRTTYKLSNIKKVLESDLAFVLRFENVNLLLDKGGFTVGSIEEFKNFAAKTLNF